MPSHGRINVSSGRPLESLAHYSRTLRVADVVLQSGTTALDRDGTVLGENVSDQIDAILKLARESMGAAEGVFENVVRARLYVTGSEHLEEAGRAFDLAFADISPAITLVPICQLARPAQLIEIELEAVDGEAERISSTETAAIGSAAVSSGGRILIGGITGRLGTIMEQTNFALNSVRQLVARAGGAIEDLVGLKIFTTELPRSAEIFSEIGVVLARVKPTVTLIGIPPLADSNVGLMVDAEAVIGAGAIRRDRPHPELPMFSESVLVNDQIYLSNVSPIDQSGSVLYLGDWAAQIDHCIGHLESVLKQLDSSLDDVIVRRYFTRAGADMNRIYGEGPGWFAANRPTALGCRITGHLQNDALVSVDAHAVRGAGENIDRRTIEV